MQVGPEKGSRARAQFVAAATLTGIAIAVGAQRKQALAPQLETIDRDISRATRITPDGERINGSWVAADFEDQDIVDLARSIHDVIVEERHLPRIARHLLSQRCLELVVGLENREVGRKVLETRSLHLLRVKLTFLRASLLASDSDDKPRPIPLSDAERGTLATLIESLMRPLCVWDREELKDLFARSDKNISKPVF